ncbi:Glycine betaine/carnitine transport binding protein GbuC [invertebrate metagenome]|uniref:Glycine betaine/carnitine transport binding protein GbuC n=1 Tax=invertebrate metagenome TaxID=1711999 RepID=A0A2H9T7I8_9ZZZZ
MSDITLGITDLSFHRVTGSLITHILERMGHNVKRLYAPHVENFERLTSGEIDMLSSAWLPSSHGAYKNNTEQKIKLHELGLHYEPYALWGVPDYVSETVKSVRDLIHPEIADRFNKKIQGIGSGAGITRFSIAMMEQYGLTDAGYQFFTGTQEDCVNAFETAVEKNEWVIVPLWWPQFLHARYTIRELEEPKGLLGIVDRAVLLLRDDKTDLLTPSQIEKLDQLRFSNQIVSEIDNIVDCSEKTLDEATSDWLEENYYN